MRYAPGFYLTAPMSDDKLTDVRRNSHIRPSHDVGFPLDGMNSLGLKYQIMAETIGLSQGSVVGDAMATLDVWLRKLPMVDDTVFLLALNAVVMLYAGISEIVLGYGPGVVFSAGAVLVGLVYAVLAVRMRSSPRLQDLEIAFVLPFLVFFGDVIVSGLLTSISVFVDVTNILLGFSAYRDLRSKWQVPPTASQGTEGK